MNDTRLRIKRCIVERLLLDINPEQIEDTTPLFRPKEEGGLELDSLAALEITVGLTKEFGTRFDEADEAAFQSVETLAVFIENHKKAADD